MAFHDGQKVQIIKTYTKMMQGISNKKKKNMTLFFLLYQTVP